MLKDFKEFAFKGSLIDMAVGFILGGAFATVVKSLVDNVIMPPVGSLMNGIDFSQMMINISGQDVSTLAEAQEKGLAVIKYGQFLQDLLSFIILAFVVFIVIKKVMNAKLEGDETDEEPEPDKQEVLLTEIRDLLKARS